MGRKGNSKWFRSPGLLAVMIFVAAQPVVLYSISMRYKHLEKTEAVVKPAEVVAEKRVTEDEMFDLISGEMIIDEKAEVAEATWRLEYKTGLSADAMYTNLLLSIDDDKETAVRKTWDGYQVTFTKSDKKDEELMVTNVALTDGKFTITRTHSSRNLYNIYELGIQGDNETNEEEVKNLIEGLSKIGMETMALAIIGE
jgi:hypothetical protein